METKTADLRPRLTLEVSEKEREIAKNSKKEFKALLKDLDDAIQLVFGLKDALIKERPSQETLKNVYRGRLLRYRRKVQDAFNANILKLKAAIERLAPITDSEMAKLREIIVSEFDALSDSIEAFLDLLGNPEREEFTQKIEKVCTQLDSRRKSINDVIDSQLFGHINSDILGRKKVSSIKADIYKRIRLLRKIS